jgi:hypothetical protein
LQATDGRRQLPIVYSALHICRSDGLHPDYPAAEMPYSDNTQNKDELLKIPLQKLLLGLIPCPPPFINKNAVSWSKGKAAFLTSKTGDYFYEKYFFPDFGRHAVGGVGAGHQSRR